MGRTPSCLPVEARFGAEIASVFCAELIQVGAAPGPLPPATQALQFRPSSLVAKHECRSHQHEQVDGVKFSFGKLLFSPISVQKVLPGGVRRPKDLLCPAEDGEVVSQESVATRLEVKDSDLSIRRHHYVAEIEIAVTEPMAKGRNI